MKNYSTPVFLVLFTFISFASVGQEKKVPLNEPDYNRPKLFQQLPASLDVEINRMQDLLQAARGMQVTVDIAPAYLFRLDGQVVSTDDKTDARLSSVVVRLTNYPGASFTLTRFVDDQGHVSYSGRIISFQHGDAFELKEEQGKYFFVKKNFYDLVNE